MSTEDTSMFSESARREFEQHAAIHKEVEQRKAARRLTSIPTNDTLVRIKLRALAVPMQLFGEGPAERRDRLKAILMKQGSTYGVPTLDEARQLGGHGLPVDAATLRIVVTSEAAAKAAAAAGTGQSLTDEPDAQTVVYTPGEPELKDARMALAQYSLPRAAERLRREREAVAGGPQRWGAAQRQRRKALHHQVAQIQNQSSEVGGDRPLSWCSFSPDSTMLAVADWSGLCKVWRVDDCMPVRTLRGHTDRANQIVWHPGASTASATAASLFSAGADTNVFCWAMGNVKAEPADGDEDMPDSKAGLAGRPAAAAAAAAAKPPVSNGTPLQTLAGHTARVNRLAVHPNGQHLVSTSHDEDWRLWDLETSKTLLAQTGHFCPVFAVAVHGDGSLVATGGLDGTGLLWDLRSGKQVWQMRGHVSTLLSADFAPSGFELATGSGDNTCRIWDLRERRCRHVVAAHKSLVACVRWERSHGDYLCTSSYDQTVKFWSATQSEVKLIHSLSGHEGKVMAFDIKEPLPGAAPDEMLVATVGYDRTWKLWAADKEYQVAENSDDSDEDMGA